MTLTEKLTRALAIGTPEQKMAYFHNKASEYYRTLPDEMSRPRIEGAKYGMRAENARLAPLHQLLVECVELALSPNTGNRGSCGDCECNEDLAAEMRAKLEAFLEGK